MEWLNLVSTRWFQHRAAPLSANLAQKCGKGWWAHWDSNPEPKDYAYHFGFRRRLKAVRGLDHAFTIPLSV